MIFAVAEFLDHLEHFRSREIELSLAALQICLEILPEGSMKHSSLTVPTEPSIDCDCEPQLRATPGPRLDTLAHQAGLIRHSTGNLAHLEEICSSPLCISLLTSYCQKAQPMRLADWAAGTFEGFSAP